jgi:hypothetical protein
MTASRRFLLALLVLGPQLVPSTALAIAEFSSRIHATIQLLGPVADIVQVLDVYQDLEDSPSTTGLPSFTNSSGSATWDPDTKTLTVIAEVNGAASYTGTPDPALVSDVARMVATLGIINPSQDIGWLLEVRVQAFIEDSGLVEEGLAEIARTFFDLQFAGSRLAGLPTDGQIVPTIRTSTRDPGLEAGYDLATTIAFLGLEEDFTVVIPPGGSGFEILDVGLFLQVGGAATSALSSSTSMPLEFLPEPPEVITAEQLLDPDGDGVRVDKDVCPDTVIPESVPTLRLGKNRWALVDDDTSFDTNRPRGHLYRHKRGKKKGHALQFDLDDTAGCSCEQIIEALRLGPWQRKLGCTTGVMWKWSRSPVPAALKFLATD